MVTETSVRPQTEYREERDSDQALDSTLWNERQRQQLQIEPTNSFGVVGIQAVPLDAMLSEFPATSAQLSLPKTGQCRTPVAISGFTADHLG
jgi:hypothetical protein